VRWATLQDRLAIADYSDGRIPKYGTPGFAILDLRLGYSFREHISLSAVIENLLDAPYRYHGSSINGPARGLSLVLKVM
jgi:iron complex outermembrane receptor protein/hemoglobin/transferrin/lactoferrin receptor protein